VDSGSRGAAATAQTIYRIGSVSKLFTAIAAMQMVEAGDLELDSPIVEVLPELQRSGDAADQITLRHLLTHRSGLPREPAIGNYFDSSEPSLLATVESLRGADLLFGPGERFKYSNGGTGAVGMAVERASGRPFATQVQRTIFAPLGMDDTSFLRFDLPPESLAGGIMWTYAGDTFQAPTFDLGMAPAGGMYSSADDLGRLMIGLLGQGRDGRAFCRPGSGRGRGDLSLVSELHSVPGLDRYQRRDPWV